MAYTFEASKAGYAAMWRAAEITKAKRSEVTRTVGKILAHRAQYEDAAQQLGKPHIWPAIAVVHYRESSLDFSTHLHNGDPLTDYTHHVPTGRPQVGHGPPFTFTESAQDAMKSHNWDKYSWDSIEFWLYMLEKYNGPKYQGVMNTPYLWRGTTKEQKGKVLRDHGPIEPVWDEQLGCVALLKGIFELVPEAMPLSDVPPTPPVIPVPIASDKVIGELMKVMLPVIEQQYVVLTQEQFMQLILTIKRGGENG